MLSSEKVKHLCQIRMLSTRGEPLYSITQEEVILEGFPDMLTYQFVRMFCQSHKGCTAEKVGNRIEFEYMD